MFNNKKSVMMHIPLTPHVYPAWIKIRFVVCSIFFILCLHNFPRYFYLNRKIKKAKIAFEAGDYERACLYYTKLLSQLPNNKKIKLGLACSLFKSEQPEAHKLALETLTELSLTDHEYNELLLYMPLNYAMHFQTINNEMNDI